MTNTVPENNNSINANDVKDHVAALLLQQKQNLLSMQNILNNELSAVSKRNGTELLAIAKDKEALLAEIRNQDKLLNTEQCIEAIKALKPLQSLTDEITQALQDCQQKNEVIYLTATQNQVAVEQTKRLLIGGSKNTTYNAYGQKQAGINSLSKGIKA